MSKTTILFLAFLAVSCSAFGQSSQWEELPIDLAPYNINVVHGDTLYYGLSPTSIEFWVYDFRTETRTRKADFPGSPRDGGIVFIANSKLYVVAGRLLKDGLRIFNDVWEYNPDSDTWTAKGNFTGDARYGGISFVIDNMSYVGMGYNGIYLRDLWRYEAETDTWTEMSSLPRSAKPREGPFAFSMDGKGYVGGGKVTMTPYLMTKEFLEYDPLKDEWTRKQDLPIVLSSAGGFTIENRGYVVGGITDPLPGKIDWTPNYACWSYNPCENLWTRQQDLPDQKSQGGVLGITGNGQGYAISSKGIDVYLWQYHPENPSPRPVIAELIPRQEQPGENVTIKGSNFSAIPGENMVYLNHQPCQVVSASSDQLTILLPENVTTGTLEVQVNCSVKATEDFVVLVPTPVWRRWWALLSYIVLGAGLVFAGRASALRFERKKLQKELAEKEAEALRKTEQLKAKFFSNITHEFRTPLTLIQGPAQELFDRASDERSQKLAQLIQENSTRLLKLINQLLDLAKLDAQEMRLNVSTIDLDARCRSVHAQFSSHASARQIAYLGVFGTLPIVSADADKLETVLVNLLSNAIKFTPNGGQVTLEANYDADKLVIRVADNGKGISNDQLPFIFNRFYQVNPSDSSHAEGTGIGLALVREYVELMGGVIHVESRVGEGTAFQVELPLAISEERYLPTMSKQQDGLSTMEESPAEGDLPFVLLIEDNSDIRAFVRECLGPRYRYAESANGNEGLQTAQELIPDLILCDWMMPGMDGLEVCTRIKKDIRTNHIPFVMLTAKAAQENKIEGLRGGADEYLVKPFHKAELQFKVDNLLSLQKNLQTHVRRELLAKGMPVAPQSESDRFIYQARLFVEANLNSEQLNVELLADAMNLSREQCYRKLMALTGLSPSAFIRTLRLQRAMDLLKANWGPVSQVAYEVGFDNLSHFSKAFHSHFGHLPSEVQKAKVG